MLKSAKELRKRALANQFQYKRIQEKIEIFCKERRIKIQTEIWIYFNYPDGWKGVLGCFDDYVLIFVITPRQLVYIEDMKPLLGIRLNGTLIY